jgi:hypothetical protein
MRTNELIKEIERLPVQKRMYVIEKTIQSIRKNEIELQMSVAAESLLNDYKTNKQLTAFTDLDLIDFYETR